MERKERKKGKNIYENERKKYEKEKEKDEVALRI
jgi:hypothetical protein